MDPREFLALAHRLSREATEADWRTAISRAYYGAFHVARLLLEGLGLVVPRADRAHAYLWLRLNNCGDPQVQQAAVVLNTLRGRRNLADYDLHRPVSQAFAQAQAQAAERIVQVLDTAAADPARRTQVMNEMARYERDVLHDVTWRP